jgi:Mg2+ and Co2+ transporter CorA
MDHCRLLYDAHQQDRTNHRLAVLTIFSAVFMPITLMAGSKYDAHRRRSLQIIASSSRLHAPFLSVWGMNFVNMPILERENAYYFALASMAVVAIILLSAFYCFGWFK